MYFKEKDFQSVLKKIAMTLDQAYKVFDLPVGTIDQNMIKRKYRQLAIENHPDRGGSNEKMKLINEAKDRLDRVTEAEAAKTDRMNKWREEKQKRQEQTQSREKELKKYSQDIQRKMANLKDKYIKHFKDVSGQDYKMLVKENIHSEYNGSINLDYKFKADDGSQFQLKLDYSFGYGDIGKPENIWYEAYFYSDMKENRLHQKRFVKIKDESVLDKPETFFPKKKITTILSRSKTSDPTLLKRKDAIAVLEREFGAKYIDKDTYRIPMTKDQSVIVMRMTFLRKGSWRLNGLYEKHRRTHIPEKYKTYFETYESGDWLNFNDFIDTIKKIKRGQFRWQEDKRR